ncbi:MAG: teichuronic acid biosynthesis glycosyltransferase TuaC [Sphingomonadales bacterium]|jgi:glycosyltransferase involved in cell wall biosynthesis|nr:teichuronic acid biosynthesis glycosyltransferase TuaC [Sphingomonadales bacterium]
MLRVLTLSTLFPNRAQPELGRFVERQTLALAARPGVEVEVAAPVGLPVWPLSLHPHYAARGRLPEQESWMGLAVHRPRYRVWPRAPQGGTPAAMANALLPELRRIRARFPFDVIDAEFFWPDGPAAMALSRALGLPFSIKARGSDIHVWGERPEPRRQIVAAGRAADGLLAVSKAMKRSMVALGLPEERIRVHYTGVDRDFFIPVGRAEPKRWLGVEGPLIVTAGALLARKGPDLAIKALALIPGATLIFVGDGPLRPELDLLARRLRVDDRVRFLGGRPHDEMPRWLATADVTLLPTVSEGLANVWVESLACGTPVVTTDVGGAREVIDRPEAGRLVAREPEALAAAVRDILAAPPDQQAVRRAAEKFGWDRNAAELEAHLAALKEVRPLRAA